MVWVNCLSAGWRWPLQKAGVGTHWVGTIRDLSLASSLIHVPLSPLSLPSCFVALQFHTFWNSSTATCTLTSSVLKTYFLLVTEVLEVKCFRNVHCQAPPHSALSLSVLPSDLGMLSSPFLFWHDVFSPPEFRHPQHCWLRQRHPTSEQWPQELQRIWRLSERKVYAILSWRQRGRVRCSHTNKEQFTGFCLFLSIHKTLCYRLWVIPKK